MTPWVVWSLAAITGLVILGGLFGMIGFLLGVLAVVLIVTLRATRKRTRKADPVRKVDPMRLFGGFCIIAGLAVILLTIPVVRGINEREHKVSLNMLKLGYDMPVREVSLWPGFIGGAAVVGFGVLILAIRRPRAE